MRGGYWMLLYNDQQGIELLKDYEVPIRRFLQAYLKPGMLFIDAGANQGFYTILAKRLGARVVAFEPLLLNRERLSRNLILNGLKEADASLHNILVRGDMVGHVEREAVFCHDPVGSFDICHDPVAAWPAKRGRVPPKRGRL